MYRTLSLVKISKVSRSSPESCHLCIAANSLLISTLSSAFTIHLQSKFFRAQFSASCNPLTLQIRKSDMLNGDLSMKNRFDAKDKKKQKKRKLEEYDEDDAAFHFIAYVPIQGDVWKLDGLDFQPTNIGISELYHFSNELHAH